MSLVQPNLRSWKRNGLIAGVAIALAATISSPAAAQISGTLSLLSSSIFGATGIDITPYIEYVRAAEDLYKAIVTGNIAGILEGLDVASGELGIPLPEEVQIAIDKVTNQSSAQAGAFGIEAALLNKVLQGQTDYAITKAGAETLLSADGQKRIAEMKETTAQVATASTQASKTAAGKNVTQDVLKQIAIQNSGTTSILKSIYDSSVDSQVTNVMTAQATSNMSKTLSDEAWGKRVDNQAGQIGLMDTTAQFSALVSPTKK